MNDTSFLKNRSLLEKADYYVREFLYRIFNREEISAREAMFEEAKTRAKKENKEVVAVLGEMYDEYMREKT